MVKKTFNKLDDLINYLEEMNLGDTRFCVDPDYITAVEGISEDGMVVYNYDKMVDFLADIYKQEVDIVDPYFDAMEWIDYNCDIPYWVILHMDDEHEFLGAYDDVEFLEEIKPYLEMVIGIDTYGQLCFDSEKVTSDDVDKIETIMKENDYSYKFI